MADTFSEVIYICRDGKRGTKTAIDHLWQTCALNQVKWRENWGALRGAKGAILSAISEAV